MKSSSFLYTIMNYCTLYSGLKEHVNTKSMTDKIIKFKHYTIKSANAIYK